MAADRPARRLGDTLWVGVVVTALYYLVRDARNIPLAEDWTLVPALTGHESDFWGWLWSQNNEHRVPLPRLLLLGLLWLAHGDFRVGMVASIVLLALLARAMMHAARRLRGGRASLADAFFPLVLLHIGHWPNLYWGWQFSFVLPVALAGSAFLTMLRCPALSSPRAALWAALVVCLLPLCGAVGLIFVPGLVIWMGRCGMVQLRRQGDRGGWQWTGPLLLGSALLGVSLTTAYFIGYEPPPWNPQSPGVAASLKTAVKFAALGLGPVASESWRLSAAIALTILVPTGLLALVSWWRSAADQGRRAFGVLVFVGNAVVLAAAIGHARAGLVPERGLPSRYALLAALAFVLAFFVWELFGPGRLKAAVPTALFVLSLILLPLNMRAALADWRAWYGSGMSALEADLAAGVPTATLAARHRDFLIHWWDHERLAAHITLLQATGMTALARR